MKARVILNPVTGRGQGGQALPRVQSELKQHGIDFDLVTTQAEGHARELAKHAALDSSFDCVIAAGGDGTVNEVINGLIEAAQARGSWGRGEPAGPLGVIPIGSGNDFAFGLGLKGHNIAAACARIAAGRPRTIDIAHVSDDRGVELFFCNNLGTGFDAAANIEARKIKNLRGFPLYFAALIRTLSSYYHTPLANLQYGKEIMHLPVLMASVANGPRTAGGFLMAPNASLNDGLLDFCVVGEQSRLGIIGLIPHFLRGTHEGKTRVYMLRADHIVIEAADGLPVHVDGEVFHTAARRLDITLWPQRLQVLA
jgi:YegS/Rv2252/BmrU family lipid kinase